MGAREGRRKPRARRRASLILPVVAALAVFGLSTTGVLGTLSYALPLLASAEFGRLFEAPRHGTDLDAEPLKARILALLSEPALASEAEERWSFDGCLLRREMRRPAASCTGDQAVTIIEQIDFRDLVTGPAFQRIDGPVRRTGGDSGPIWTVALPWRPRAQRAAETAQEGLALLATDPVDLTDTGSLAVLRSDPPRLDPEVYGDAMATNHRLRVLCDGVTDAEALVDPVRFEVLEAQSDELAGLLYSLGDRLCRGSGWLF
ncbi:MAG: hypothetical protein AAGC57_01320 [Pseudomonadota bacterium]